MTTLFDSHSLDPNPPLRAALAFVQRSDYVTIHRWMPSASGRLALLPCGIVVAPSALPRLGSA
jgi:hypothetical protein